MMNLLPSTTSLWCRSRLAQTLSSSRGPQPWTSSSCESAVKPPSRSRCWTTRAATSPPHRGTRDSPSAVAAFSRPRIRSTSSSLKRSVSNASLALRRRRCGRCEVDGACRGGRAVEADEDVRLPDGRNGGVACRRRGDREDDS